MPAAAILVDPANAVDCEFLNLNFLKDTRFFAACYFRDFCFHVILLSFFVAPIQVRCDAFSLCNRSANKYNVDIQRIFSGLLSVALIGAIMKCGEIVHIQNYSFVRNLSPVWQISTVSKISTVF